MPNALTVRARADIVAELIGAPDAGALTYILDQAVKDVTLTNGTGANQSDLIFMDTRTLTASATENLDLAGSLTDPFGATLTFARIKAILVMADAANTNSVQIGGAASNAFINWVANSSDIVNVRPGGRFLIIAPDATAYAVTASTGDILKMANSAGSTSVTYTIVIIGSSA